MKKINGKILAIIPARDGSKGIPKKNLQKIGGISLIGHAANSINNCEYIDKAIISTDSQEMANEARKFGIEVPFIRPPELSDDKALGVDVWRHAWLTSEDYFNTKFEYSIFIEPTSPLRKSEDLDKTLEMLFDSNFSAAATVSRTPAHFTPHKTLKVQDSGTIGFYLDEGARFSRRQEIPNYYHRNGICYAARRDHVVGKGLTIEEDTLAVIIDRPIVNIDDQIDLDFAEWLIERAQKHPITND